MNIVSPVGLGLGGRSTALAPTLYQTGQFAQSPNVTSGNYSGSQPVSTTSAVTQIHSAVSQMLQSVGGGIENNKMLQMLIALMILLALLEQAEGQDKAAREALAELGTRRGGQQQFFSAYSSSTTISWEYTSTTFVFGSEGAYVAEGGTPALPQGGEVDMKA